MTTPIDICNQALATIGARSSIASFTDGTPESDACALFYQTKVDALFRAAHWGWARRQVFATQLKAVTINGALSNNPPPQPWAYEYGYPSDALKIRFLLPNMNPGGPLPQGPGAGQNNTPWSPLYGQPFGPISSTAATLPMTTATTMAPTSGLHPVPFVIASDFDTTGKPVKVVLCNETQAQIVYTARIDDPDQWDGLFLEAAIATLGAWLVNPINMNAGLAKQQMQIAMSIVQSARVSDGNESWAVQDHQPDWLRVRGSHGAFGGSHCVAGWDALSGPDGSAY